MAATASNVVNLGMGGVGGKFLAANITLDSAYAVAGETITAATFGLAFFNGVWIAENEDGYIIQASLSTSTGGKTNDTLTIKIYVTGNATTSAATMVESSIRDLSAVVIPVLIWGI